MNNESRELNITLILMLLLVFFLTYCAIPFHETEKVSSKPIPKMYKKKALVTQDKTMDAHVENASSESEPKADDIKKDSAENGHEKQMAQADHKPTVAPPSEKADGMNVIAMDNPKYKSHKKGIVLFTHQKHIQDYAIECGSCHHDEKGTPLKLSQGDPVKGCIECHTETEKPKDEKLSNEEKIAKYHFEAMHANCVDCHKSYNIEKGDPKGKAPAPVSCTQCHPKK
ncbi:MAG: cytochrome c3 family protein [Pseudomonadota bacterium]